MAEQNAEPFAQQTDNQDSYAGQSRQSSTDESASHNHYPDASHSDDFVTAKQHVTVSAFNTAVSDSSATEKPEMRAGWWKARAQQFDFFKQTFYPSHQRARPWRTTLIRFGPLSGIFCMFLAIASIIASLGILAGSDEQLVSSWSTPPSTYLAIFTAIANLSMRYSAIQGVVIAWWLRALNGSTLSKLHWEWRSGTTLRGAITAGRHMGLLGLACLFSTIVVVDGPLLQRASTVHSAPAAEHALHLNVTMAPEIPRGFTGYWSTSKQLGYSNPPAATFNDTMPTPTGEAPNDIWGITKPSLDRRLTALWYADAPLGGVIQNCPGECKAKIMAPALFPTICKSHQIPMNYFGVFDMEKVMENEMAPPLNSQAFVIDALVVLDDHEVINLMTGYTDSKDCVGDLNYTICTMESGIGEYEVLIKHNKILMEYLEAPTLVAIANNTAVDHNLSPKFEGQASTLAGLEYLMFERWVTLVAYGKAPHGSNMGVGIASEAVEKYIKPGHPKCPAYRNPHEDMLSTLNKLAVYVGALAAQSSDYDEFGGMDAGLQMNTTVIGYPSGMESVFQTNYWFFFAAALVEVVCVALVAPTYWGWWKIGRPVSFSPLELAKAFESPMLSECNSNSSGRDLAENVADDRVKYGVIYKGEKTKLTFAEANEVTFPRKDMRFEE